MKTGAYEIGSNLWSFATRWAPRQPSYCLDYRNTGYPGPESIPVGFVFGSGETYGLKMDASRKGLQAQIQPFSDIGQAMHGTLSMPPTPNPYLHHRVDSRRQTPTGFDSACSTPCSSNQSTPSRRKRRTIIIGAASPTCVDLCGNSHPPNKCKKLRRKRPKLTSTMTLSTLTNEKSTAVSFEMNKVGRRGSSSSLETNLDRLKSDTVLPNIENVYMPTYRTGNDHSLSFGFADDTDEISDTSLGMDSIDFNSLDMLHTPSFSNDQLTMGDDDTISSFQSESMDFSLMDDLTSQSHDDHLESFLVNTPAELSMHDFHLTPNVHFDLEESPLC
eukprot:CFRG5077T1